MNFYSIYNFHTIFLLPTNIQNKFALLFESFLVYYYSLLISQSILMHALFVENCYKTWIIIHLNLLINLIPKKREMYLQRPHQRWSVIPQSVLSWLDWSLLGWWFLPSFSFIFVIWLFNFVFDFFLFWKIKEKKFGQLYPIF